MSQRARPGDEPVTRGLRVLAATDLREPFGVVLRDAARMAASTGGTLGVIHVLSPAQTFGMHARHDAATFADRKTLAEDAVRARVGREADVFVTQGIDHEQIVKHALEWDADVVVLGAYGDVAHHVIRNAPYDVLVARACPSSGRVLAATEEPETSTATLRAGADAAKRRGGRLEVARPVGFLDLEASYILELSSPSLFSRDERGLDRARSRLADALAALGIDADCEVLDRPSATAIVDEAKRIGAELVVVGYHDGLLRPLAETVAKRAPCSVLVVHA
jgi:nucleotide-binding universal stress UspA family protein